MRVLVYLLVPSSLSLTFPSYLLVLFFSLLWLFLPCFSSPPRWSSGVPSWGPFILHPQKLQLMGRGHPHNCGGACGQPSTTRLLRVPVSPNPPNYVWALSFRCSGVCSVCVCTRGISDDFSTLATRLGVFVSSASVSIFFFSFPSVSHGTPLSFLS